jgi:hypothetical protein
MYIITSRNVVIVNFVKFDVFKEVTAKNVVIWNYSEERIAPIIRVTKISEIGTLAVTYN